MAKFIIEKGGTFEPAPGKKDKNTEATDSRIDWRFKLSDKCDCAFLVSVFYVTDTNGNIVDPKVGLHQNEWVEPSHGGFNVDGCVVDTPAFKKKLYKDDPDLPIKCVAYRAQSRKGDLIEGYDQPDTVKNGYRQFFETAVICFDREAKGEYVVLGTMRWKDTDKVEIMRTADGEIDRKKPSRRFKKAVADWIKRFGNDCKGRCAEMKEAEKKKAKEKAEKEEKKGGKKPAKKGK
ncbi:MAG: hypothetical protein JJ911_15985 [Rhizobiaceae bacterium]|nr:hypothetical protein [Rhizobiaceae bacterium]